MTILTDESLKALIEQGLSNGEITMMFGKTSVTDKDIDRIRKLFEPPTLDPFAKDLTDVREGNRRFREEDARADIASLNVGTRVSAGDRRIDEALRLAEGPDLEIEKMVKRIQEAADGNPLEVSITEEQVMEGERQSFLQMMLQGFIDQNGESSEGQEATSTTPAPKPTSSKPAASKNTTKKETPQITPEDMASLTKSINTLSEKVVA